MDRNDSRTDLSILPFVRRAFDKASRVVPILKHLLRTAFFRTAWYSDDHTELEHIFRTLKDPWNFERSSYEQARLQVLLDEVKKYPHESVLEVGCAEGAFTEMLGAVAARVVAIDVSPTAVSRARERCPAATCMTQSLQEFSTAELFDLAVCAETLYYIKNVTQAINKLSSLARVCMVSYLGREARRLDPLFEQRTGTTITRFRIGEGLIKRTMIVVVWRTDRT